MPPQQIGAGDYADRSLVETAHNQLAFFQGRRTDADGESNPSPITSTRRLALSTCNATSG